MKSYIKPEQTLKGHLPRVKLELLQVFYLPYSKCYWNIAQTVGFLISSASGPFNKTGTSEIHSYLHQIALERTSLPKILLY